MLIFHYFKLHRHYVPELNLVWNKRLSCPKILIFRFLFYSFPYIFKGCLSFLKLHPKTTSSMIFLSGMLMLLCTFSVGVLQQYFRTSQNRSTSIFCCEELQLQVQELRTLSSYLLRLVYNIWSRVGIKYCFRVYLFLMDLYGSLCCFILWVLQFSCI